MGIFLFRKFSLIHQAVHHIIEHEHQDVGNETQEEGKENEDEEKEKEEGEKKEKEEDASSSRTDMRERGGGRTRSKDEEFDLLVRMIDSVLEVTTSHLKKKFAFSVVEVVAKSACFYSKNLPVC